MPTERKRIKSVITFFIIDIYKKLQVKGIVQLVPRGTVVFMGILTMVYCFLPLSEFKLT